MNKSAQDSIICPRTQLQPEVLLFYRFGLPGIKDNNGAPSFPDLIKKTTQCRGRLSRVAADKDNQVTVRDLSYRMGSAGQSQGIQKSGNGHTMPGSDRRIHVQDTKSTIKLGNCVCLFVGKASSCYDAQAVKTVGYLFAIGGKKTQVTVPEILKPPCHKVNGFIPPDLYEIVSPGGAIQRFGNICLTK